jgi:tRNA A-37 threonylcarbamoyl transferase component Bud32/CheY-like chemotaxis protein
MAILDAQGLAQLAIKVGLLTPQQVQEVWDELGERGGETEPFLRVLERKGQLTPWQSAKLLKEDPSGYFLGGYRILYKVQSGSFGRVFRAEDPGTGRVVAIKVLRRRWSEDKQRIELFEREGKLGLGLHHPNIVEILTTNRDPGTGQYYIVMDFVEGGNLREILQIRKKLEPGEALKIIEDAGTGLAYAYSRGMTHRDMKLTNILIASSGTAKLVDFGLAKIYAGTPGKDEEKVERTVDYAGLEKATGVKPGDVRSDIYFLGCVLYEILTGRSPLVTTRDRHQRMQKQRFDHVEPMKAEEVNGPPSLFRLVETMMSLDPRHRYQTASQLLDAIRAVRRDIEGKAAGGDAHDHSRPRWVFVAERDEKLQDAIRDGFKKLGYRVLIAGDPERAIDRFRQQPFDALIVDAGTTDEDGLLVFERIMTDAERTHHRCAGILVLNEDQVEWKGRVKERPTVAVLTRPGVTLKGLVRHLTELVPPPKTEAEQG